ncbi:type VI secretion system protein TssA [Thiorhodococcus mannitoliphagus]|uniref:Type VI secretion system protein TssA n=1 Tax=Thiorhodococcus mannitoliphagus TaxID=329406 RepID=A0A6P1DY47_9GAMM|nr:type VI secretion system protein TssA [Thiorhodococcus mannitoliphagus]NEX22400.1 type VI secretion system protein TssA [Thiorhodococcus mannitoliphagus]
MIDIQGLLREVSPEAPCGENLEYDPAYGALERATEGKPEQQFGDTIIPAEEPEWPEVERQALELLARTKDLRVATHLTRALIRTRGWPGFRDGLSLIKGLIEHDWNAVHPQLDPDDDNDPTLRVNTLLTLSDPEATLEALRDAPLVQARGIGSFSLRDLQIAHHELPLPKDGETSPPEPQLIDAAFQEVDLDQLQTTMDSIQASLGLTGSLEALLAEAVGVDASPDLSPLSAMIQAAHKAVSTPLTERTGAPLDAEEPDAEAAPDEPSANPAGKPLASSGLGAINNRADVVRALDLLIDYYRRQEPSSPIPLLLNRAKRLVSKDFLEILEDLAPDGLSQAQVIRGPESDS